MACFFALDSQELTNEPKISYSFGFQAIAKEMRFSGIPPVFHETRFPPHANIKNAAVPPWEQQRSHSFSLSAYPAHNCHGLFLGQYALSFFISAFCQPSFQFSVAAYPTPQTLRCTPGLGFGKQFHRKVAKFN